MPNNLYQINLTPKVMKKLFVYLPIALFVVFSCQNKNTSSELNELKAKAELEDQNIALIEKYIEAWNNKNLSALDEMVDSQYKFYLPSINPTPMSSEQFKGWYKSIYHGFPDVHYDIKEILADGNKVIVWWIFTGTHENDYQGLAATGNKLEAGAIEIFKIQNGKIIEERGEVDAMGMSQQLGLSIN